MLSPIGMPDIGTECISRCRSRKDGSLSFFRSFVSVGCGNGTCFALYFTQYDGIDFNKVLCLYKTFTMNSQSDLHFEENGAKQQILIWSYLSWHLPTFIFLQLLLWIPFLQKLEIELHFSVSVGMKAICFENKYLFCT
ncbi:uncharacterized protein LOC119649912 [Hermetia illucens]|uniref:uncharacterized protein LOC119649912 n=1 Tax=Hermetia illucens TaxID=343691 RepID=UPI0018CC798F|nr:uncharacterized protein LOC119649912 [Hermetia illucens]